MVRLSALSLTKFVVPDRGINYSHFNLWDLLHDEHQVLNEGPAI
jgi:hypothetical protein